ncbi:7517_t:CDS:2 [Gigaspora margarita]|uniref:7517_t:CDS:1 n=1 Tax=Gigaspora margarita TaxID=4874 RepID=A0ABN7UY15_GIGMA|nr:7517_t:CDS:2 [Gigaspora margarita]
MAFNLIPKSQTTNIETFYKILKTLAIYDKELRMDFFSKFGDYSVSESFSQIFGFTFSEEDINEVVEQFQNERQHLIKLIAKLPPIKMKENYYVYILY